MLQDVERKRCFREGGHMNVALIAHDAKKKLMENFTIAYRHILIKHTLYATGTTGRLVEEATNLNIYKYLVISISA